MKKVILLLALMTLFGVSQAKTTMISQVKCDQMIKTQSEKTRVILQTELDKQKKQFKDQEESIYVLKTLSERSYNFLICLRKKIAGISIDCITSYNTYRYRWNEGVDLGHLEGYLPAYEYK